MERQRTEWIENRQREIEQKIAPLPNAKQRERLREKNRKRLKRVRKSLMPTLKMRAKLHNGNPTTKMQKRIGLPLNGCLDLQKDLI